MIKNLKKDKILYWLGAILLLSFSVLIFSKIYEDRVPKLVEEINNGAIGAILTAIITVFLLSSQSEKEERVEKGSKIFEEKLKIYSAFLKQLKEILEDKKISKEEVHELIFQLSFLKMHSKGENIEKVSTELASIIDLLYQEKDKDQPSPVTYQQNLSKNLFEIVGVFQEELYEERKGTTEIQKLTDSLEKILKEMDELMEGQDINDDIQTTKTEKWAKTVFSNWDEYYNFQIRDDVELGVLNLINYIINFVSKEIDIAEYEVRYSPTHVSFYLKNAKRRSKIYLWLTPYSKKEVKISVMKEAITNKLNLSDWQEGKRLAYICIANPNELSDSVISVIKSSYQVIKSINIS
jgi:hypothetical protein